MKRLVRVLVAAVGLCCGCSHPEVLTPEEFTREFVETLKKASPGSKVTILRDLEVKFQVPGAGGESTSFLNNAYDQYKLAPKSRDEVIQRFVALAVESAAGRQAVDRAAIVPVIKDREWSEDARQAWLSRGAKAAPRLVYEEFGQDLIVLYAEDCPKGMHFLEESDLESAKLERKELRSLACENLKRLLPKN
jgi:hypothetical protein